MPEYLTTREVADLLRIKERKVYDLAATGKLPHNKAMGKLLFSREAIETWLADADAGGSPPLPARPIVFLGSHDPLLDWALRESQCGIASWFDGSTDGLNRFEQREGLATGLHLPGPDNKTWNLPFVTPRFDRERVVLVRWATRQRGLIVSPGIAKPPQKINDIGKLKFAPRQAESGAQVLFEDLLKKAKGRPESLNLSDAVRTEADAALAVLEGKADVSFGLASLAARYRLPFVPIINEQFDILVERRAWFEAPMQTFLAFCASPRFRDHAVSLSGYDISDMGQVRFNAN